jgi:hypothetical protein
MEEEKIIEEQILPEKVKPKVVEEEKKEEICPKFFTDMRKVQKAFEKRLSVYKSKIFSVVCKLVQVRPSMESRFLITRNLEALTRKILF